MTSASPSLAGGSIPTVSQGALVARGLVLDYGRPGDTTGARRHRVLDIPRLELAAGDRLAITGPSGGGKTSLLHVLSGIARPTEGQVAWDGIDIAAQGEGARDRWRRLHAGFVFQNFHLVPGLSARANVLLPATFDHLRAPPELTSRAQVLLERVGLERHRGPIDTMSRGEQQRVAIARAMLRAPRIILADEPTASLDPQSAAIIADLLVDIAEETPATLIVVTHDQRLAERLGSSIRLVDGQIGRDL